MSILFSLAPVGLRAVFGTTTVAFGADPLPVYPYPRLIRDRDKGDRLAATLGSRAAVLLRGHGCAVVGGSLQETVTRVLDLERNGRIQHQVLAMGQGEPSYWTAAEVEEWAADNRSGISDRVWEYLTSRPR
jgi:ribulose-5-phosphate 4-epimerase/fuculose-1-phosphate aldolase